MVIRSSTVRRLGGLFAAGACLLSSISIASSPDDGKAWRSSVVPEPWEPPGPEHAFFSAPFIQDFSGVGFVPFSPPRNAPFVDVTEAPFGADARGKEDSTAAIQAAIDLVMDAGGGTVFLPPGTYRVSVPEEAEESLSIQGNNVQLLGAGPEKTFLLNTSVGMRNKVILRIGSGSRWHPPENPILLTEDITGPSHTVVCENPGELAKGDWVILGHEMTEDWIDLHGDPSWQEFRGKRPGPHAFRQVRQVNPRSGAVELDLPARTAFLRRDHAFLKKWEPAVNNVRVGGFSIANREHPGEEGWGNEDYRQDNTPAHSVHRATAVVFERTVNALLEDVASFRPPGNRSGAHLLSLGVRLLDSRGVTLDNVRLGFPQYGGGGGNGYLFDLRNSSDNLLHRCTAEFSRHGFSISGPGSSGNVFWQCEDRDTGRFTGASGSEFASGSGSDHHMHFSHSNLFDSCTVHNSMLLAVNRPFGSPLLHGETASHSTFWNITGTGDADFPIGRDGARPLGATAIATGQRGTGLVIGTQGPRHEVHSGDFFQGSPQRKDEPTDRIEGVGKGQSLIPSSIFQEQLRRSKSGQTAD